VRHAMANSRRNLNKLNHLIARMKALSKVRWR
jgi:hypothetical protein